MDFKGKVVAITGAASGLGKGLAERFAKGGAKLSLADIDFEKLAQFEEELKSKGIEVITDVIDVRDHAAVQRFADKTFEVYGEVDYLINNAGISSMGSILRMPLEEFSTVFDINVMGILRGLRAFVPRMIEQDKECYVINTASAAGLESNGLLPAYFMSKHAAVSISESFAIEMQTFQTKIKTFVFCPGLVPTNLSYTSAKIKGDHPYYHTDEAKTLYEAGRKALENGLPLEDCMDGFFAALEADEFYIRTHLNEEDQVVYRTEMVLSKHRPAPIPMRKVSVNV